MGSKEGSAGGRGGGPPSPEAGDFPADCPGPAACIVGLRRSQRGPGQSCEQRTALSVLRRDLFAGDPQQPEVPGQPVAEVPVRQTGGRLDPERVVPRASGDRVAGGADFDRAGALHPMEGGSRRIPVSYLQIPDDVGRCR